MRNSFSTLGSIGLSFSDDAFNLEKAIVDVATLGGVVYVPAGEYVINRPLNIPQKISKKIALVGDGSKVSSLVFKDTSGLSFSFLQDGAEQPSGITVRGLTLRAKGQCDSALTISYGKPVITSEHFRTPVLLNDVVVESSNAGAWRDGIIIEGCWNPTLDNVFVSGSAHGGDWDKLSGTGIMLKGMCVNAHLVNVRANFWATGIMALSDTGGNTEGIFCGNCSMVGVQRGVWIVGSADEGAGRISTFNWTGGMIECRVQKVAGGKAAFHLQNVWTSLITGCQMLTDSLDVPNPSYGVIAQDCNGVVVSACDINAFTYGFMTTGACHAMCVHGNTFTNTATQVLFTPGTESSRSYGNVCVNNARNEIDQGTGLSEYANVMGFK